MIIVEGNIGAGKSTLLKMLHHNLPHYTTAVEPLEQWHNNQHGNSLLSLFYSDPHRWAYTMEMTTLISRVRDHEYHLNHFGKHLIIERSLFSGRYCFAHHSYISGYMNASEWNLYEQWYHFFLLTYSTFKPQAFIYLKVDPEIAYERIKKRNRKGEEISLCYLERIGHLHDQFLLHRKSAYPELENIPVLCIDGTLSFEHDQQLLGHHIQKVQSFVKELL